MHDKNQLNTKFANNQSGHSCIIGVTSIKDTSLPNVSIDDKKFDLIPNNRNQVNNVKIIDTKVVYTTNPWVIETKIYIDGVIYVKTIALS